MPRNWIPALLLLVVLSLGAGIAWRYRESITTITPPPAGQPVAPTSQNGCLRESEEAVYELINEERAEDSARIVVKDKATGTVKKEFTIPLRSATHYHPIEVHSCGVYAVREFNYDHQRGKVLPGYRAELVGYDFRGDESTVFKLGEFSLDFRIDPRERYLVLARGYLGSPDFALVIKDLKTLEDVFVLPIAEVAKKNPDIVANLMFNDWTKDGRYFWANFFVGAPVLGYIRIDSADWTYELFPAPKDVLGGDQLNLENGWLTVHPGNVWFGEAEADREEKARRRAQGIGTDLYIENLITKERLFIAHTDEPLHYFRPKWLSPTELRYIPPSGEEKIFRLPE